MALIELQILATSDVHGTVTPNDKPGARGGLSKISTLVRAIRNSGQNCLLLDNGDFLQGSMLCDFAASDAIKKCQHPVIQAMNHLAYDAAGLGNHEFDYGVPFLNTALKSASFPVLGTNIRCPQQRWQARSILKRRFTDAAGLPHDLRIGLMSLLPEQVVAWNAAHLKGVADTEDIIACAVKTAKELRRDGADLVICLLHSGISASTPAPRMENAAIPVAKLADIDVLVCGHSHHCLPEAGRGSTTDIDHTNGLICGVPAVMPGYDAAYLGQISLQLKRTGTRYHIHAAQSRLLQAHQTANDQALLDKLAPIQSACAERLRTKVGILEAPIHSFYARLPGDTSVALMAEAQLDYARHHLSAHLPNDLPLLSSATPYRGGGRGEPGNYAVIQAGPVTQEDLSQLQPFKNTLVALHISGNQLTEWLEMCACCFNLVPPNSSGTLLNDPEFPCYGFDTVFGVRYDINLSQPARYNVLGEQISDTSRVENLTHHSRPISPGQKFIFLTNSYRAGGGGYFPAATDLPRYDLPFVDCRDILAYQLTKGVQVDKLPPSPWRFATVPKATATALIGPGVAPLFDHGRRPDLKLSLGPPDAQGFLQCTVSIGEGRR